MCYVPIFDKVYCFISITLRFFAHFLVRDIMSYSCILRTYLEAKMSCDESHLRLSSFRQFVMTYSRVLLVLEFPFASVARSEICNFY